MTLQEALDNMDCLEKLKDKFYEMGIYFSFDGSDESNMDLSDMFVCVREWMVDNDIKAEKMDKDVFLEIMDSLKTLCAFLYLEEEGKVEKLEDGKLRLTDSGVREVKEIFGEIEE